MERILRETIEKRREAEEAIKEAQLNEQELANKFNTIMEIYAARSVIGFTARYFENMENSDELTKEEFKRMGFMGIQIDNVPLRKISECYIIKSQFIKRGDVIHESTDFRTPTGLIITQTAIHYIKDITYDSVYRADYTLSCEGFKGVTCKNFHSQVYKKIKVESEI